MTDAERQWQIHQSMKSTLGDNESQLFWLLHEVDVQLSVGLNTLGANGLDDLSQADFDFLVKKMRAARDLARLRLKVKP